MDLDGSDAGCFGDATAVRVQRVLHAARAWVAEQERMVSHGNALMLLHAQRLPLDRLEAWVRCFERVLAHAPRAEMPALLASLRAIGARAGEELSLHAAAASDVRAAAAALERARPLPRGWMLAELPADASGEAGRDVLDLQEMQAAAGLAPLPGWFLHGAEGRAVTLALRDDRGALAGSATVCVAPGPGEAAAQAARDGAQLDRLDPAAPTPDLPAPMGMPVSVCLRSDARGQGLSPVLAGAALRAGCERFALRGVYAAVRARDAVALRVAARCGFSPHPSEAVVLAEPG